MPSGNELYIVGIGPGARDQMTCRAVEAIEGSEFIVGHSTYVDMIGDLAKGKEVISSKMGKEVDRAKRAVELLGEGSVSLISSGDPNVYGMAGLGLEMASKKGCMDSVKVVPGVTSFTAAACRAGITFLESVAVISLSDLLTPWSEIERKVELAAFLEMPVALYNPRSRKRNWQLDRVLKIYEELGQADAGVLIAKNVMRSGEELCWTSVKELLEQEDLIDGIDMFTLLIIEGRGMTWGGNLSDNSRINIVGIGPGDPGDLTLEALGQLGRSQKIFGAERYLNSIRDIAAGELISHEGPINQRAKKSYHAAIKSQSSSILFGGNPSVFSSVWRILEESARCRASVHIITGVSAFSAVAARTGAPIVGDFVLLSGLSDRNVEACEGKATNSGFDMIVDLMNAGFGVVVYNTKAAEIPGLLEAVNPYERPCALAQDVCRPGESVAACRLSDLEALIRGFDGSRLTLVIASPNSYIKEGRIITLRGYETKYSY